MYLTSVLGYLKCLIWYNVNTEIMIIMIIKNNVISIRVWFNKIRTKYTHRILDCIKIKSGLPDDNSVFVALAI